MWNSSGARPTGRMGRAGTPAPGGRSTITLPMVSTPLKLAAAVEAGEQMGARILQRGGRTATATAA